jgi:threonine dehydrogenase-like Zn-dependent dehydrogenase
MKRFSIKVSRRSFLKSAAAMAAVPLWYAEETFASPQTQTPKSANDKPGIALIGCGGQGRGDCSVATHFGNIVAVCDLDENRLNQAAEQFKVKNKFKDFRKLLECKDVDIVITGTPEHWHTMVNIAASNAGKDIYSEKPLTLTIAEGKKLVEVIRKNKTILQVGSQQRSEQNFRFACELVRNGRIGKLKNIVVGLPIGPREAPLHLNLFPIIWIGIFTRGRQVLGIIHISGRITNFAGGMITPEAN